MEGTISFEQILIGGNSLLTIIFMFFIREFWTDHKGQHARLQEQMDTLDKIFATKTALTRAHERIDNVERAHADIANRLVSLETWRAYAEARHGRSRGHGHHGHGDHHHDGGHEE